MLQYARSDTHFLLYIYDNLRNALLDRAGGTPDLIRTVLERSEQTALRTYESEVYDYESGAGPGGWDTLAQKWNKSLSGLPMVVFRCAHAWRDRVAREEDESTRFVTCTPLPRFHFRNIYMRTLDMCCQTTICFNWRSSHLPTWQLSWLYSVLCRP